MIIADDKDAQRLGISTEAMVELMEPDPGELVVTIGRFLDPPPPGLLVNGKRDPDWTGEWHDWVAGKWVPCPRPVDAPQGQGAPEPQASPAAISSRVTANEARGVSLGEAQTLAAKHRIELTVYPGGRFEMTNAFSTRAYGSLDEVMRELRALDHMQSIAAAQAATTAEMAPRPHRPNY